MNHLVVGLWSLFLVMGTVLGAGLTAAEHDKAGVTRLLTDYYAAFSTLNLQAILSYYLEPCLLVSARGVVAAPTHPSLAATLTPALEGLRAAGYARSELTMLYVKRLSATTALASGVAVRYKTDGHELERVGVTYVLHSTDGGWKIATLIAHDADDVMRLGSKTKCLS
jgi:ketosteroid isomerase-like protein